MAWLNAALHPEKEAYLGHGISLTPGASKTVRDVVATIDYASLREADLKDGWLEKRCRTALDQCLLLK